MKKLLNALLGAGALCATAVIAYKLGVDDGYDKGLREADCDVVTKEEEEGEPIQPASPTPDETPADEETEKDVIVENHLGSSENAGDFESDFMES